MFQRLLSSSRQRSSHAMICECENNQELALDHGKRSFIKTVGGLGVLGGSIASLIAHAQSASPLIDTHHHFYPPEYHKAWLEWENQRKIPHFAQQENWTLQNAISAMDKAGVTKAISVSYTHLTLPTKRIV